MKKHNTYCRFRPQHKIGKQCAPGFAIPDYDKGYAQAIEDAAKVAESIDVAENTPFVGYRAKAVASFIAVKIKALLDQEKLK